MCKDSYSWDPRRWDWIPAPYGRLFAYRLGAIFIWPCAGHSGQQGSGMKRFLRSRNGVRRSDVGVGVPTTSVPFARGGGGWLVSLRRTDPAPGPSEYGAGFSGMTTCWASAGCYFHSNWPCRLPPAPWKMKMAAANRVRGLDGGRFLRSRNPACAGMTDVGVLPLFSYQRRVGAGDGFPFARERRWWVAGFFTPHRGGRVSNPPLREP